MSSWADADGRLGPGAEWYASAGWKVLPCWGIVDGRCACGQAHDEPKDMAKHPLGSLVPTGLKEATSDVATVQTWWRTQPQANVGVVCKDNSFLVVDIDPRNGGLESLDRLDIELGEDGLCDTVEARTGLYTTRTGTARGRHLFYRVGPGESFKQGIKDLPGIDFKWKGYVLVHPSRHASGLIYEWEPGHAPWEREMADCPQSLLELIRKRAPVAADGSGYGTIDWNGEKLDVDALLEEGIFEGERATKLFAFACHIANKFPIDEEYGRAAVRAIVRKFNNDACHPPMDWGDGGPDDFAPQCDNAIRHVQENPKSRLMWDGLKEWKDTLESGELEILKPAGGGAVEVPSITSLSAVSEPAPGAMGNMATPPDRDAVLGSEGGLPGARTLTDIGNGRRLVDYAGERLRHTPGLGWFVWNGDYWMPDVSGLRTQEIAKRLPVWIAGETARTGMSDEQADATLKWAGRTKSSGVRKNAVGEAASDERTLVAVERWDSYPELLGVRNGVINLKTGDLMEGNPELYITKQTQVAYTPGVTSALWTNFLRDVTGGDLELQRWLQLAAGYTLTGYRHHEVMFLVHGPAGSGKSTFLEVLKAMLGGYSLGMSSDVLTDSGPGIRSSDEYYMAKMMGRRMILISELRSDVQMREDSVKRLTGESTLSGRNPGGQPFEFEAQGKLWVGTNYRPHIRDRAMWRRIRAIPFDHVPDSPDPELKPRLLDPNGSLPAALAWAVDGAVAVLSSSDRVPLAKERSAAIMEATTRYEESEDQVGLFLEEETKVMAGGSVPVVDLHFLYKQWCEVRGDRTHNLGVFARIMEEKGLVLSGKGNKVVLHEHVVAPRAVTSTESGSWTSLVNRSR